MKKAVRRGFLQAGTVLRLMIFIGFCIQLTFGILWLCRNFPGMQEFGESAFYLEVSESLICDEYTGILYPLLLRLARGAEALLGLPFYIPVYGVQLLAAFYGGFKLLGLLEASAAFQEDRGEGEKPWKKGICRGKFEKRRLFQIFGSLGLLTLPMALQCHLAVLPASLVGSLSLLEIAFSLELLKNWRTEALAPAGVWRPFLCWVLCALLLPEYFYLGMVPLLCLLAYGIFCLAKRKGDLQKKTLFRCLLAFLAGVAIIAGVSAATQERGYYGRVDKSIQAAAVSRFAWSSLLEAYEEWPGEVREAFDWGELQESAFYPDNMTRVFGPLLEEAVGKEQAKQYFQELARLAWNRNQAKILHQIAWDAAGYLVSPLVLQLQLQGRGYDSCSGRNYEVMRHDTPYLTRLYMDYSCWWFAAGIFLGGLLCLTALAAGKIRLRPGTVFGVFLVLAFCGCLVLWYTMQGAGIMDYKHTIAVNCLWAVGILEAVSISSLEIHGREEA